MQINASIPGRVTVPKLSVTPWRVPMVHFTYRCPRTGQQVQGWAADDLIDGEIYGPVTCIACGRILLVNFKSGKVLESAKK